MKTKQEELLEKDPLDPEIAKLADSYIVLIEELEHIDEAIDLVGPKLMSRMKDLALTRVKHHGHVIKITSRPATEALKVTKLKKEKSSKKTEDK